MARPFQQNAADREQGQYADRKVKRRKELLAAAMRQVMSTPAGRLVLGDLLEEAGLYDEVFHPNIQQMSWNEGRRVFAVKLRQSLLATDFALFQQLEAELRARAEFDEREAEARERSREAQRAQEADT